MAKNPVLAYNGQAPNGIDMTTGQPMGTLQQVDFVKKKAKAKKAPKKVKLI